MSVQAAAFDDTGYGEIYRGYSDEELNRIWARTQRRRKREYIENTGDPRYVALVAELDRRGIEHPDKFHRTSSTRRCEQCGGAIPDRMARQRNDRGQLVCEECSKMNLPAWDSGVAHSSLNLMQQSEMRHREAQAIVSISRVARMQREAAIRLSQDDVRMLTGHYRNDPSDKARNIMGALSRVLAGGYDPADHATLAQALGRTSMLRLAHDSGDGAVIHHCPFCGGGDVTARSDGSVECGYCHSVFTVQMQPSNPNMPQTINGQPSPPPGMPNGQQTEVSGPDDLAVQQNQPPSGAPPSNGPVAPGQPPSQQPPAPAKADPATNPGKGHDQPPWLKHKDQSGGDISKKPDSKSDGKGDGKKKSLPPWLKNKKSFRTTTGAQLPVEDYVAHLALANADDRDAVLDMVRVANVRKQAVYTDSKGVPIGVYDLVTTPDGQAEVGAIYPDTPYYEGRTVQVEMEGSPGYQAFGDPGDVDRDYRRFRPEQLTVIERHPDNLRLGSKQAVHKIPCPTCGGTGIVGQEPRGVPGPNMSGLSEFEDIGCPRCNGAGWVDTDDPEQFDLREPPDEHGANLRQAMPPFEAAGGLTPVQLRALKSVGDWGGIDALPATFRWLKDYGYVEVDSQGRVTLTDKGREAISNQKTLREPPDEHEASRRTAAEGISWSDLRAVPASTLQPGDRFYKPVPFEAYYQNSQTGEVQGAGLGPGTSGSVVVVDSVDPDGTIHAHSEGDNVQASQKPQPGQIALKIVSSKHAATGLTKHEIKATEIREGDYLDPSGKHRVHTVHPREQHILIAYKTKGARSGSVRRHHKTETVTVWRRA